MVSSSWSVRKRRILLTENSLVLLTIYLMELSILGYKEEFHKQDVVNEVGRLFSISNKTTLKAIKILKEKKLIDVIGKKPSIVRLTDLGREVSKHLLFIEKTLPSSDKIERIIDRLNRD